MQRDLFNDKNQKVDFKEGSQKDIIMRILAKDPRKWWNAGNITGEHMLDGSWVWVSYKAQARLSELKLAGLVEYKMTMSRNTKTQYTIFKHKSNG